MRLATIGAYGFSEGRFFDALRRVGVDTFVDIRQRRGVRGSEYAFVNSTRLQDKLAEIGIRYVHELDLAPTAEIRQVQRDADAASETSKRDRSRLSPEFASAYRQARLSRYTWSDLERVIGTEAKVPCLFCVEGRPEACHRSLVVEHLLRERAFPVENITP